MIDREANLAYLCCPRCYADLSSRDQGYICEKCSILYEEHEGIADFYMHTDNDLVNKISSVNNEYYDQTGAQYEQACRKSTGIIKKVFKNVIEKDIFQSNSQSRISEVITKYLPKDGAFLDVGCGTGNILRNPSLANRKCFGIDISMVMLGEAQKHQNNVFRANNYRTPFKTNAIDMIGATSVIHHMVDLSLFFKELARILKPGGVLYTDLDPNPLIALIKKNNKLYATLALLLRNYFKKDVLQVDCHLAIDKGQVDYHYHDTTPSPAYNLDNLRRIIHHCLGPDVDVYYHSNASSIFKRQQNITWFDKVRRILVYTLSRNLTLAECSEYMTLIAKKRNGQ